MTERVSLIRGDTWRIDWTLEESVDNGQTWQPIDITSYEIVQQLKYLSWNPSMIIAKTAPLQGEFTATLPYGDSEVAPPGDLATDVQFTVFGIRTSTPRFTIVNLEDVSK